MQFLYMARRDKHTVEFISIASANKKNAYKRNLQIDEILIDDVKKFELQRIYYPNRMDWELIVEEASDFNSLRQSLKKRGYKFLPTNFSYKIPKNGKPFIS